jgi:hypothetical protein
MPKVDFGSSTIRKRSLWVFFVKAPDIQVLYAVFTIQVMKRSPLAKSNGKQPTRIEPACFRLSLKQVNTISRSQSS